MNRDVERDCTVIVAPLNWGLGHASRSIPVIRMLSDHGYHVIIASDGDSLSLLREYFPTLNSVALPSYHIRYSYRNTLLNGIKNLPSIVRAIREEHNALQSLSIENDINLIISDHRLGMWHPNIPSVLIAHQLNIPFKYQWMSDFVGFFHHRFIRKFDALWIPDDPDLRLSGEMSDIDGVQLPFRHIGLQSALQSVEAGKKYKWLAILSGPEPARTTFEDLIWSMFSAHPGRHCVLRGKPCEHTTDREQEGVNVVSHAIGEDLSEMVASSEFVICRCGYSSVMDMMLLDRKTLFVPTPGQPEQFYLAETIQRQERFGIVQSQDAIDLEKAEEQLSEQREYISDRSTVSKELLSAAIRSLPA